MGARSCVVVPPGLLVQPGPADRADEDERNEHDQHPADDPGHPAPHETPVGRRVGLRNAVAIRLWRAAAPIAHDVAILDFLHDHHSRSTRPCVDPPVTDVRHRPVVW
jgi:hypothetical protein